MSVLIGEDTRVLVQGITGRQASRWVAAMVSYGTRVVAGVVPGRYGSEQDGIPIYDSVRQAIDAEGANAAIAFVPGSAGFDAVMEDIDANIPVTVYPGDSLPVHDALRLRRAAEASGTVFVGPNTSGLMSPGKCQLGFMPGFCYRPGPIGVIAKSGSLSYEACMRLSLEGLGQSTVIGVGGDPVKGLKVREALDLLHRDSDTSMLLVLGEIGGEDEYAVAEYSERYDAKSVVAFMVGRTAPRGQVLGHAGAIIAGPRDTYEAKRFELDAAGVTVAASLSDLTGAIKTAMERLR